MNPLMLLTGALTGTTGIAALAMWAARIAAFPPEGLQITLRERIELYSGSVAMLLMLGKAWLSLA